MNAKQSKETAPMLNKIITPTFVGEGCRSQGSLLFSAEAEVFGIVEGDIEQESTECVQIGKSGWVRGSIQSKGPVIVEGRVEGSISSKVEIRLGATASVMGSIQAPSVTITAGALFEGEVHMQETASRRETTLKAAA